MPDTKSSDPRQPKKKQGSTEIERDDVNKVANDEELDFDVNEADREDEAITQRSPRVGERQGQRQVDRGQEGTDRDRNRE